MEIIDLAKSRQERFQNECDRTPDRKHYNYTIFAAIYEDDSMETSTSPDILEDAEKCILIHNWVELKVTNWYPWFRLEYINEKKTVTLGVLDDGYTINIVGSYSFPIVHNAQIELNRYGEHIYSPYIFKNSLEERLVSVWDVYCKCKEYKTTKEAQLIGKIAQNEIEILELKRKLSEKEFCEKLHAEKIAMYKQMLKEIEKLLKHQ